MKATAYLVILSILVLPACRTKELSYQSIQNFSMEQGAKPSVVLDIRLYNPNHYSLKLKNADVDVFLNGTSVGKLQVEGTHIAPKLDTFLLPVKVEVTQNMSIPKILQMVMGGDIKIKLTGSMKGGRHGIYVRVPVDYEGTENLLSSLK